MSKNTPIEEGETVQSREQYLLSLSQKLVDGEALSDEELANMDEQERHDVHAEARVRWLTNLGEQIGAGKFTLKDVKDAMTREERLYVESIASEYRFPEESTVDLTPRGAKARKSDPVYRGKQLVRVAKRRGQSNPDEVRRTVVETLRKEYPELLDGPYADRREKGIKWMEASRAVDLQIEELFKQD